MLPNSSSSSRPAMSTLTSSHRSLLFSPVWTSTRLQIISPISSMLICSTADEQEAKITCTWVTSPELYLKVLQNVQSGVSRLAVTLNGQKHVDTSLHILSGKNLIRCSLLQVLTFTLKLGRGTLCDWFSNLNVKTKVTLYTCGWGTTQGLGLE